MTESPSKDGTADAYEGKLKMIATKSTSTKQVTGRKVNQIEKQNNSAQQTQMQTINKN